MKRHQFAAIVFTLSTTIQAQNVDDVLRYSQSNIIGTARAQAVGGAFGAVGADFSSTQINPAGLGLYKRNEMHLSSAILYAQSETNYIGKPSNDGRTIFNIPSAGVVLTNVFNEMGKDVSEGLVSLSFGLGLNRINNFQRNTFFNGNNTRNSIADYFAESANGKPFENFNNNVPSNNLEKMAWDLYIIDTVPGSTSTYRNIFNDGNPNPTYKQTQQVNTRGAIYEYNLSVAANINDMLYIGGGLLLTTVSREYERIYTETLLSSSNSNKENLTFKENIQTSGNGVSGRLGIIFRPVDLFRMSLSAQTATRLYLRDDYFNSLSVSYMDEGITGPKDFIKYEVITPARYNAGAMIMLGSFGFLSTDIEMIDYGDAFVKSEFDFSDLNSEVASQLKSVYNIRLGAEFRIADIYRMRFGAAQFQSPYRDESTDVGVRQISGGFGVIVDRFFYDFAIVNRFGNQVFTPYTMKNNMSYSAVEKFNDYHFTFSMGYRF